MSDCDPAAGRPDHGRPVADADSASTGPGGSTAVAEVALHQCHDAAERGGLESHLTSRSDILVVHLLVVHLLVVHLDRTSTVARVSYDQATTDIERIRSALRAGGYLCDSRTCAPSTSPAGLSAVAESDAHEDHPSHGAVGDAHPGHGTPMLQDMRRRLIGSAILTLPVVIWSALGALLGIPAHPPFGMPHGPWGFALATPVILWGGWVVLSSARRALRHGDPNMTMLIVLGVLVSYGYSVAVTFFLDGEASFEAPTMLTTIGLLGHRLDMRARFSTGKAAGALPRLAPATACERRAGRATEIPLHQVVVGDVVAINPGDRISVDGTVPGGHRYVGEAKNTGEPTPANKQAGSTVVAGTVYQTGAFTFRTDAVGAGTGLARIVQMVPNAQIAKAPAKRRADRAGKVLVHVALGADELAFVSSLLAGDQGRQFALLAGVSALAMVCHDPPALAVPDDFDSLPGLGVAATVDGATMLPGNGRLLVERGLDTAQLQSVHRALGAHRKTATDVASGGALIGIAAVANTIRPSARRSVTALHGMGITTVMLTGDNGPTANAAARELGLDTVIAEVPPADRATKTRRLRTGGPRVAIVGAASTMPPPSHGPGPASPSARAPASRSRPSTLALSRATPPTSPAAAPLREGRAARSGSPLLGLRPQRHRHPHRRRGALPQPRPPPHAGEGGPHHGHLHRHRHLQRPASQPPAPRHARGSPAQDWHRPLNRGI